MGVYFRHLLPLAIWTYEAPWCPLLHCLADRKHLNSFPVCEEIWQDLMWYILFQLMIGWLLWEESGWFDSSGTLRCSCTSGRSVKRWQGRNMNAVVAGCAPYHINKPPQCIILRPSGLDRSPEQRDWKSFESGVQSRTNMKWKLPTSPPVNTNQEENAVRAIC